MGTADRPDSDGEDSEGADDDNEDDNEEEEDDSQAESGLSTNPSVSASPQHIPSSLQAELPPSSLLAQLSIHHHHPAALSLPQPPASDSHTHDASDTESVPMLSPVSLVKQMSISGGCSSPLPYSPPPHTSGTESVPMMSPVSPCRQMSIDYPDFDVPPCPPAPGKSCSKLGQVSPTMCSSSPHPLSLHPSLHPSRSALSYPFIPIPFHTHTLPYPYPCYDSLMRGTSTNLF